MKMTQIVLKTAIWSFFLIFSMSSLNAQVDTPGDDDNPELSLIPPGTAIIDNQRADNLNDNTPSNSLITDNCEGFVDAYVFVTNLHKKHKDSPYFFPTGATPIFLAYQIPHSVTIGVNTGIIQVPASSFEFTGMIDPESGMDIFESLVKIPIDFASICNGLDGTTSTSYQIQIVSDLEGTPYPFLLNNGPEDLFSCSVFCDDCTTTNTSSYCIDDDYFHPWTGSFVVECNGCEYGDGNNSSTFNLGQGNSFSLDKDEQQIASELRPPLQVMPNPANLETDILFYSESPEEVDVLIFDATGRTVYKQSTKTTAGDNKINISVNTWEKGIYYGYLKSKSDSQSFRFLKL